MAFIRRRIGLTLIYSVKSLKICQLSQNLLLSISDELNRRFSRASFFSFERNSKRRQVMNVRSSEKPKFSGPAGRKYITVCIIL